MTLVELLIVLAVIALLSSIAVPSFMKMIGSSQTDVDKASTNLHKLLQTARIYAMSHRVPAGVAYRVALKVAEPDPAPEYCDVFGMVVWNEANKCFVPVIDDVNTEFQKFTGTSCLARPLPEDEYYRMGVVPITVRFRLDDADQDRPLPAARISALGLTGAPKIEAETPIYAHIFEPSGAIQVDASSPKERYEFMLKTNPTLGLDAQAAAQEQLVEIYRSTGRVKIITP